MSHPRFNEYDGDCPSPWLSNASRQRIDELFGELAGQFQKAMDKKVVTDKDSDFIRMKKQEQIATFLRIFRVKPSVSVFQAEAYRFIAITEIAHTTFMSSIWIKLVKGVFGVQPSYIRNFFAHADFDCGTGMIISSRELEIRRRY